MADPPTAAQSFLGAFPSLNPFSAVILLTAHPSLHELITLSAEGQAALAIKLPIISPVSLELFYRQLCSGELQGMAQNPVGDAQVLSYGIEEKIPGRGFPTDRIPQPMNYSTIQNYRHQHEYGQNQHNQQQNLDHMAPWGNNAEQGSGVAWTDECQTRGEIAEHESWQMGAPSEYPEQPISWAARAESCAGDWEHVGSRLQMRRQSVRAPEEIRAADWALLEYQAASNKQQQQQQQSEAIHQRWPEHAPPSHMGLHLQRPVAGQDIFTDPLTYQQRQQLQYDTSGGRRDQPSRVVGGWAGGLPMGRGADSDSPWEESQLRQQWESDDHHSWVQGPPVVQPPQRGHWVDPDWRRAPPLHNVYPGRGAEPVHPNSGTFQNCYPRGVHGTSGRGFGGGDGNGDGGGGSGGSGHGIGRDGVGVAGGERGAGAVGDEGVDEFGVRCEADLFAVRRRGEGTEQQRRYAPFKCLADQ